MKKRILILLMVLFVSLGFSACKKDPYSKMSLEVSASEVNLSLTEMDNEIVYGDEAINVSLSAPKGVSSDIVLPKYGEGYGDEYVDIAVSNSDGKGNYELTLTAKKQGQTQIQLKSAEGYLSKTIKVNIDVSLTGLNASGTTPVVEIGGAPLDFNVYGKNYVNFVPTYTTQTNLEFSIENYDEYSTNNSKFRDYCLIENNVLIIKEGYAPSNPSTLKSTLTIRATSVDNPLYYTTFDVKIVQPLNLAGDNFEAKMYYNITSSDGSQSGDSIVMKRTEGSTKFNANYEVMFASPIVDDVSEISGLLKTPIFGGTLNFKYGNNDYKITYVEPNNLKSTIVDIESDISFNPYSSETNQSFGIQANDAGEYIAQFKVEYTGASDQYKLIEKTINVKITVVALPTTSTILINDEAYANYVSGTKALAVYDAYATGDGTKLKISTTATKYMQFSVNDELISVNDPLNSYGISDTGVDIRHGMELVEPEKLFNSGSTLIIQNKTGKTDIVELEFTLSTKIFVDGLYGDIDEDDLTFAKTIKIRLNLITGLGQMNLDDHTLDVVKDAPGTEGVLLHEFPEGVNAESVVDKIEASDTSLFSVKYKDNKIFLYATPYVDGSTYVKEGKSSLVVHLTNGIRSYTTPTDGSPRDTVVTVGVSYETFVDGGTSKFRYATVINQNDEDVLGYGRIELTDSTLDYTSQYVSSNYVGAGDGITTNSNDGYQYTCISNLIIATHAQVDLDLYRIFVYNNAIKYINPNQITITSGDNSIVRWADGSLNTFGSTTFDSGVHTPVTLTIGMNNDSGTPIVLGEIQVYVVKRIEKVKIVQENFELYDANTINDVYGANSTATIKIQVYTKNEYGELGYEDVTTDNVGYFGNYYQPYYLVNPSDFIGAGNEGCEIPRAKFFDGWTAKEVAGKVEYEFIPQSTASGLTEKLIKASSDISSIDGSDSAEIKRKNLFIKYNENGFDFKFAGDLWQFNQSYPIEFNINVKHAIPTTNVYVDVNKETGIYFESDNISYDSSETDRNKIFNHRFGFTYSTFPSNATFKDVFVDIFKANNDTVSNIKTNYIVSYYNYNQVTGADGKPSVIGFEKYYKYSSTTLAINSGYTSGYKYDLDEYDMSLITGDTNDVDFIIEIRDGYIEVFARYDIGVGEYIIKVNSVDSFDGSGFGVSSEGFNLNFADGSEVAPYQIRSTAQFYAFLESNKNVSGKHYVLATDVYLGRQITDSDIAILQNNLSGRFKKTNVDGTEFTKYAVYNLSIKVNGLTTNKNVGLFSDIAGGYKLEYFTVSGMIVEVSASAGNINVGGLVGQLTNGEMIGCKVDGNIKVTNTGNASVNAGGMVGSYTGGAIKEIPNDEGSINNSDINAIVGITYLTTNNISANLGGIAGYMGGLTLDNVRAIATIVAIKDDSSQDYASSSIGGIVGSLEGGTISNIISYPSIVGYSNVGGIVGSVTTGTIDKSQVQILYNGAMKNVIAGYANVGGVIGQAGGDVTLTYTYIRSYYDKDFYRYQSSNNEFYLNYTSSYHGAVVLLDNELLSGGDASVGGLVGTASMKLTIADSYVMTDIVSMNDNANIGGLVGTKGSSIVLNNSFIDGEIAYFAKVNEVWTKVDCYNVITATVTRTSHVINGAGATDTTYSTYGNLTSVKNSYIVITRVKNTKNSVVEYKDKIEGLSGGKFYARVNDNLFGIVNNVNSLSTNPDYQSFKYRGYAAKTEKLTLIIFKDDSNLKIIAKNEVLEVSPNSSKYNIYSLPLTNKIDKVPEELASQLLALGLYNEGYNYIESTSTSSYDADNDVENTLDDTNFNSLLSSITLNDIASMCNESYSVTSGTLSEEYNRDYVSVVKTISPSSITIQNKYNNGTSVETFQGITNINFDDVDGNSFTKTFEADRIIETTFQSSSSYIEKYNYLTLLLYVDGYTLYTASGNTWISSSGPRLEIVSNNGNMITTTDGKNYYFAEDTGFSASNYKYVWLTLPRLVFIKEYEVIDNEVEIDGKDYSVYGNQLGSFDEDGNFIVTSDYQREEYSVNSSINITSEEVSVTPESVPEIMSIGESTSYSSLKDVFDAYEFNPHNDLLDDNPSNANNVTQVKVKYDGSVYYKDGNNWYKETSDELVEDENIIKELNNAPIIVDRNLIVYFSPVTFDGKTKYTINELITTCGSEYGIYIDNEKLYVLNNPHSGEPGIQVGIPYYDIVASTTIHDSWFMVSSLNNGFPVKMMSTYNMVFNESSGTFSQGDLTAKYELWYDTIGAISLSAKDFVPTGDDYIWEDVIHGQISHGHIKVDDSTVVLMYNEPITLASGESKEKYNTYYISFGVKTDGYYFAQLNGSVVDLTTIKISAENDQDLIVRSTGAVEIAEDKVNGRYKVVVKSTGEASIIFYNLKDDSVNATLKINVIKGFTNFEVSNDDGAINPGPGLPIELETLVGDEPSHYVFSFNNSIGGNTFEANNGGYKLILESIDGISKSEDIDPSIKYTAIKINNTTIDINSILNNELEFEFETPYIAIQGINQHPTNPNGKMVFKIMPYITYLDKKVEIADLEKELIIKINNPAQDIMFTENKASFSATEEKEVSVSIITNKANEGLVLKIEGTDITDGSVFLDKYISIYDTEIKVDGVPIPNYYGVVKDNVTTEANIYSLLQFRLKHIKTEEILLGGATMYYRTFVLVFSMNYDNYRIQTTNSGVNAVLSGRKYELTAYPETHVDGTGNPKAEAIKDKFQLNMHSVDPDTLDYYFYPYLIAKDSAGNKLENTSKDIVGFDDSSNPVNIHSITPGDYGLLKLQINPKFSDVLSVEVVVDPIYYGLFDLVQLQPDTDDGITTDNNYKIIKKQNIHNKNTYLLWEVPYLKTTDNWRFGEYYVALYAHENCPQGITVPFTFNIYNSQRDVVITKTMSLYIERLPHVSITIDNEESVVRGVGQYVKLDIVGENVGEIFTLDTKSFPLYTYEDGKYTEIDEFDGDLSKTYYINTLKDHDTTSPNYHDSIGVFEFVLETQKSINGHLAIAVDTLQLQVVWLTLEKVVEPDDVNGVITMKTGMYKGLDVNIATNWGADLSTIKNSLQAYIDAGNIAEINGISGSGSEIIDNYIKFIRNSIAGRGDSVSGTINNFWSVYTSGGYSQLQLNKTYSGFKFSRYEGVNEDFYRISAINVSTNEMRLEFEYYYDEDGVIQFGKYTGTNKIITSLYSYNFTLNIKQNSSEDSPVPIYDEEDLRNMSKGENYILQSDITLTDWVPMEFDSAYLDGNGFTITIGSFDLRELKGNEEVYAGIFSTIAQGSIIKNLNINVAPLLYTDTALSKVLKGDVAPNIDLLETPTVYFGLLAGQSDGIIINVKVVNMDIRKSNNTLYIGISRNYFNYDDENILSNGQVATLISINNGVITNSFVGVNEEKQLERTQVVDTSNTFNNVSSTINPFNIESSNNVAGFVYSNGGTISNCYVKSVSITNNSRISSGSSTAGFVGVNAGEMYSCAVTSTNIIDFKSADTRINSSSNTGGFAYNNSGTIEDCYTTIQINNKNVQTAGFVFNNEVGSIKNSYTTSKNIAIMTSGNTNSHALFAGGKPYYGVIDNCYYLILGNELGGDIDIEVLRNIDPAIGIKKTNGSDKVEQSNFGEFNFATGPASYDGVWHLDSTKNIFPQLAMAEGIGYYSSRSLADINVVTFEFDNTNKKVEVTNGQLGANREVFETLDFNRYSKKDIWYFNDGDLIFEVDSSMVSEHTAPTIVEITKGDYFVSSIEYNYAESYYVIKDGNGTYANEYKIYFTNDINNSNYHKVEINSGAGNTFNNYTFKYLGFEFVVIANGSNFRCMYLNTDDTYTFLTSKESNKVEFGEGTSSYVYSYVKNNPGSLYNPLIVTNSEEFARYIVTNTNEYILNDNTKAYIFGLKENAGDNVNARYIQLANNIDFHNDEGETDRNIAMSYEVNNSINKITINDVIFNGVLFGNAMSINNIILNSSAVRENYGIFNEVGVNDALRWELTQVGVLESDIQTSKIFNVKLFYQEMSNSEASKVGLLAGTISNAVVNKIDIVGVDQVNDSSQISGKNLVGALAGLITGDVTKTKISEITVSNVNVLSKLTNIANLNDQTKVNNQAYTEFINSVGGSEMVTELKTGYYKDKRGVVHDGTTYHIEADGTIHKSDPSCSGCTKYCDDIINVVDKIEGLSYAGGVVGAIVLYSNKVDSTIDTYNSYNDLREIETTRFSISDLSAKDMIVVQSAISGGIAGYIGGFVKVEDPSIKGTGVVYTNNLYLELSKSVDQCIFGYGYAGGIVGQAVNARFMKTTVAHAKDVQDQIDKEINSKGFNADKVSKNTLFSKMDDFGTIDTTKYNVAIGGIVGYMTNTWLVDATSKTNVVNANSYIAGGVVGRAVDTNYLAYVYTIGNVKAKNMIGGLIGYYYNSGTTKLGADGTTAEIDTIHPYDLHLYNTFAVNVWSSDIKDLLIVNEKAMQTFDGTNWVDNTRKIDPETGEEIIKTLVGAMPEIGNQQLNEAENVRINTTNPNVFATTERYTYIGSLIGRYTRFNIGVEESFKDVELIKTICAPLDTPYDGDGDKKVNQFKTTVGTGSINVLDSTVVEIIGRENKTSESAESEEYYTYFSKFSFNVISSTYGGVTHTGSIEEGNLSSMINTDKLNLSYFNSVYDYAIKDVNYDNYNSHDIAYYYPVLGKQYYVSYITGDYVNRGTHDYLGNKYYDNEFSSFFGFVFNNEKSKDEDWFKQNCPIAVDATDTTFKSLWTENLDSSADSYLTYESLRNLALYYIGNGYKDNAGKDVVQVDSLEMAVLGAGMSGSSNWYVNGGECLPKYGYNTNDTFGIIDNEQAMIDALKNGQTGKTYRIELNKNHMENIEDASGTIISNPDYDASCGSTDSKVYHVKGWVLKEGTRIHITNNTYYSATPVTIVFDVNSDDNIGNLFNIITGCTFININFEFNVISYDGKNVRTSNTDGYFGFFASVLNGCIFSNCNFKINDSVSITLEATTGVSGAPTSFGFVVGQAMNTVFNNCNFTMPSQTISAGYSVKNIGGFVGNTSQSTFLNCDFKQGGDDLGADDGLTISFTSADNDNKEHNWGGIFGLTQNTRLDSNTYAGDFKIDNSILKEEYGATAYNMGAIVGQLGVNSVMKSNVNTEYSGRITALGLLGKGDSTTFNIGLIGYINKAEKVENLHFINTSSVISIANVLNCNLLAIENANLNVGVIGKVDGRNSGTTLSNVVNKSRAIEVWKKSGEGVISVGGIVGYKSANSLVLSKTINSSQIVFNDIEASGAGTVNVGGLVGGGSAITIKQSANYGVVYTRGRKSAGLTRLGGLIGSVSSSATIDTVINYGDIEFDVTKNTSYYVGGLIGYANSVVVKATLSLGNLINRMYELDGSGNIDKSKAVCVANNEVKKHIHGMVNLGRSVNESTFTNSHYIAEHDPYHAYNDDKFGLKHTYESIAWQYVDFVSKYNIATDSYINKLLEATKSDSTTGVDTMYLTWSRYADNYLPVVDGLDYNVSGSKFTPIEINANSDSTSTTEGNACVLEGYYWNGISYQSSTYANQENIYYVLTSSVAVNTIDLIAKGVVITSTDKSGGNELIVNPVVLEADGSVNSVNSYSIENNFGSISNIRFNIQFHKDKSTTYSAAITHYTVLKNNYGNLMNVGFYSTLGNEIVFDNSINEMDASKEPDDQDSDTDNHTFSVIDNNAGNIIATGTNILFNKDTTIFTYSEISYFANNNASTGLILHSYTSSQNNLKDGIGEGVKFAAIALKNAGTISHTYYSGYLKNNNVTIGQNNAHISLESSGTISSSYVNSTNKNIGRHNYVSASQIKKLVDDDSWKCWTSGTFTINRGFPYIKNGIQIPTQQGKDWYILNLTDLREFIDYINSYANPDGEGVFGNGTDEYVANIEIDLDAEATIDSIEGGIKELAANATIKGYIKGNSKTLQFINDINGNGFVQINNGEINQLQLTNVTLGDGNDDYSFIGTNKGTVNLDLINSTIEGSLNGNNPSSIVHTSDGGDYITVDNCTFENRVDIVYENKSGTANIYMKGGSLSNDLETNAVYSNAGKVVLTAENIEFTNNGYLVGTNNVGTNSIIAIRLLNNVKNAKIGTNGGPQDISKWDAQRGIIRIGDDKFTYASGEVPIKDSDLTISNNRGLIEGNSPAGISNELSNSKLVIKNNGHVGTKTSIKGEIKGLRLLNSSLQVTKNAGVISTSSGSGGSGSGGSGSGGGGSAGGIGGGTVVSPYSLRASASTTTANSIISNITATGVKDNTAVHITTNNGTVSGLDIDINSGIINHSIIDTNNGKVGALKVANGTLSNAIIDTNVGLVGDDTTSPLIILQALKLEYGNGSTKNQGYGLLINSNKANDDESVIDDGKLKAQFVVSECSLTIGSRGGYPGTAGGMSIGLLIGKDVKGSISGSIIVTGSNLTVNNNEAKVGGVIGSTSCGSLGGSIYMGTNADTDTKVNGNGVLEVYISNASAYLSANPNNITVKCTSASGYSGHDATGGVIGSVLGTSGNNASYSINSYIHDTNVKLEGKYQQRIGGVIGYQDENCQESLPTINCSTNITTCSNNKYVGGVVGSDKSYYLANADLTYSGIIDAIGVVAEKSYYINWNGSSINYDADGDGNKATLKDIIGTPIISDATENGSSYYGNEEVKLRLGLVAGYLQNEWKQYAMGTYVENAVIKNIQETVRVYRFVARKTKSYYATPVPPGTWLQPSTTEYSLSFSLSYYDFSFIESFSLGEVDGSYTLRNPVDTYNGNKNEHKELKQYLVNNLSFGIHINKNDIWQNGYNPYGGESDLYAKDNGQYPDSPIGKKVFYAKEGADMCFDVGSGEKQKEDYLNQSYTFLKMSRYTSGFTASHMPSMKIVCDYVDGGPYFHGGDDYTQLLSVTGMQFDEKYTNVLEAKTYSQSTPNRTSAINIGDLFNENSEMYKKTYTGDDGNSTNKLEDHPYWGYHHRWCNLCKTADSQPTIFSQWCIKCNQLAYPNKWEILYKIYGS